MCQPGHSHWSIDPCLLIHTIASYTEQHLGAHTNLAAVFKGGMLVDLLLARSVDPTLTLKTLPSPALILPF